MPAWAAHMCTMDAINNSIIHHGHRAATKKIQVSLAKLEKGSDFLVKSHVPYVCITTCWHSHPGLGFKQLNPKTLIGSLLSFVIIVTSSGKGPGLLVQGHKR